ncbi:fork head domain transcription factor slp1-like [Zeugodacus cucurbitae]|uniref:fork head domain transcription factor slp1-like n=1 Tax=Zeugodacus cucurbitae TaxID=28588 RepID=UPI0023D93AD9|nr:fork head domain transcription factor slp1-like [Zeugodacus cucurbitae]
MAHHLQSSFSIRNLLACPDGTNPALTPPPSDGSLSPNTSMSSNEENHGSRPNLTYSALVTMAIRSSPEGKLTLNAIQSWISDNFPFYRKDEKGWQNQIRQTLSTNSCFLKIPRALDDPGRGNYWGMSPDLAAVGSVSVGNGTSLGSLVNGVAHPTAPNAVYFPTPQEIGETQRAMLMQAMQEQHAWFSYHQQQAHILQQQWVQLQQQQLQHQYAEIYQRLVFHQQQMASFTGQQVLS